MTPAPNRLGKPCATIAGRITEPIATTVAGDEPDTAANSAQATTPARPSPPCQCPTMVVANLIMRRATPPCVRKVPARMKNGIAMISKFSIPVNSLSATDSVGTSVSANMKVSTVRPSAIDTGMPVNISAISSANRMKARMPCGSTTDAGLLREANRHDQERNKNEDQAERPRVILAAYRRDIRRMKIVFLDAFDMGGVVVRQLPGPVEPPGDLQEAEAHQPGAERDRRIDDPHPHFEIVRTGAGMKNLPDEGAAEQRR